MAKNKKTTAFPAYVLFPDNPRTITENEFLALGESMGESGSLDGIVVNVSPGKYENAIISGNQRAKHIGLENIEPTITERLTDPTPAGTVAYGFIDFKGERFPYREVYWSEMKCEVNNLRANNYGGHNDPQLLSLFSEQVLAAGGIDIDYEQAQYRVLQNFSLATQQQIEGINQQKEWVGMPDFEPQGEPLKIVINFENEQDRASFQKEYNLSFLKKESKTWTTWFPFKEIEDLASLKYE